MDRLTSRDPPTRGHDRGRSDPPDPGHHPRPSRRRPEHRAPGVRPRHVRVPSASRPGTSTTRSPRTRERATCRATATSGTTRTTRCASARTWCRPPAATVSGRPPIETVSTIIGLFLFLLPGASAAATTLFRRGWIAGAVAGTLIGVYAVTADQVFMQNAASLFGIALAALTIALIVRAIDDGPRASGKCARRSGGAGCERSAVVARGRRPRRARRVLLGVPPDRGSGADPLRAAPEPGGAAAGRPPRRRARRRGRHRGATGLDPGGVVTLDPGRPREPGRRLGLPAPAEPYRPRPSRRSHPPHRHRRAEQLDGRHATRSSCSSHWASGWRSHSTLAAACGSCCRR